MNKHPINHVFQGVKYHNLVAQKPDFTGLACYKCYDKNGDSCAIDSRNQDYGMGIPIPCIKSNYFNSGGDCTLCSDKPCPINNSCLPRNR
jgi:hypothetical protein